MGKINSITKQTDNRYVNLYNVKATSVHNTPVNYFVASRARDVESLKLVTRKNKPDGNYLQYLRRKPRQGGIDSAVSLHAGRLYL